ncbi:MAG TPA: carboxyltransferase domain-containing protein, partial [Thermoanaerobaculia bacterium]|nr:carboxyltransferase domain-containing protein [Thermoanaerobaculia bacterium]
RSRLGESVRRVRAGSPLGDSPRRALRLPVLYGGEAARELPELSRAAGVSEPEFAARHAGAAYKVAFLGFAPGFAYLTGLPAELQAPRLSTPRTRVPEGSVAIGGEYTGIYPAQMPGGWKVIGRAPVRLFDSRQDPPALFAPGDEVRFEPIGPEEFEWRRQRVFTHEGPSAADSGPPLFRVTGPGLWTSVQGGPRPGGSFYGVPPGGAMDQKALAEGNAVLGNARDAAALEITLSGPELEALADCTVSLAGAGVAVEQNGKPLARDGVSRVYRGDRLGFGAVQYGARSYLCVAGGLGQPSRPEPSRRLGVGETVFGAAGAGRGSRRARLSSVSPVAVWPRELNIRVVLGPQEDRFEPEGLATFFSSAYRVVSASDRRGVRLEGSVIARKGAADIPPEGTALGAIQVANDGLPIVLGPDRPVTGGYTKIATVIGADFPLVAQAAPGTLLRFAPVRLEEALTARAGLPL